MKTHEASPAAIEMPRQISVALAVGLLILPMIFAWFTLSKGYRTESRIMAFGWAIAVLALSQMVPSVPEGPAKPEAAMAEAPKAAESKLASTAAPKVHSAKAESDYLDLLDNVLEDSRKSGFFYQEDRPQTTWTVSVGAMGATATLYEEGKKIILSPAAKDRQKSWKQEVGAIQAKAFPRLRLTQAKALDEALWELDVRVEATGPGYSTLRLTGFPFGANRNIKGVMDKIHEDALATRVRCVEFRSYAGGPITTYTLEPLTDTALATFAFNKWTPVD